MSISSRLKSIKDWGLRFFAKHPWLRDVFVGVAASILIISILAIIAATSPITLPAMGVCIGICAAIAIGIPFIAGMIGAIKRVLNQESDSHTEEGAVILPSTIRSPAKIKETLQPTNPLNGLAAALKKADANEKGEAEKKAKAEQEKAAEKTRLEAEERKASQLKTGSEAKQTESEAKQMALEIVTLLNRLHQSVVNALLPHQRDEDEFYNHYSGGDYSLMGSLSRYRNIIPADDYKNISEKFEAFKEKCKLANTHKSAVSKEQEQQKVRDKTLEKEEEIESRLQKEGFNLDTVNAVVNKSYF